jgi:hypothetical protein
MADDDNEGYPDLNNLRKITDDPRWGGHKPESAPGTTTFGAPSLKSKQEAIDWVDNNYACVWILNKLLYINERLKDERHYLSKKDFVDSIENIRILVIDEDGNGKPQPVSKLWLEYPQRRTYERGIISDPRYIMDSKITRSGIYNTWPGFPIEEKQGSCPLFLSFVKEIICNGNEKHYHYVMCWIAQILQEPWNKLGTSIVLQGLKGIGKSYFASVLAMLMNGKPGEERKQKLCLTVDNKNAIFGNHNDHLEDKLLLVLEEAIWAGDKQHESTLKHVITGNELHINPKNLPARQVKNYIRTIIIGNADWIVPASQDERRFFVLNVSSAHKDDRPYFDAMHNEIINCGGLEALKYILMRYDHNSVNLRTALVTEALIEQKTETMSGVEKWWFDLLCSGKLPFVKIDDNGNYHVIKERLFSDFCRAQARMGDRNRYNERSFGMRWRPLIPQIIDGQIQYAKNGKVINIVGDDKYVTQNERLNVYVIPKLEICRALMDFRLKTNYDWSDGDGWEVPSYTETDIMRSYNHM